MLPDNNFSVNFPIVFGAKKPQYWTEVGEGERIYCLFLVFFHPAVKNRIFCMETARVLKITSEIGDRREIAKAK